MLPPLFRGNSLDSAAATFNSPESPFLLRPAALVLHFIRGDQPRPSHLFHLDSLPLPLRNAHSHLHSFRGTILALPRLLKMAPPKRATRPPQHRNIPRHQRCESHRLGLLCDLRHRDASAASGDSCIRVLPVLDRSGYIRFRLTALKLARTERTEMAAHHILRIYHNIKLFSHAKSG